ncbi:hypothetical protein [Sphingomonas sp. MMS24-J13]|uniref:hypothetical protein n=1 Tax=Sphingomonas sp. MMS24-J13 TaxID=3238686 RepID=UPI00385144AE
MTVSIPMLLANLPRVSELLADAGHVDQAQLVLDALALIDGSGWWQPLYTAPRDGTWVLIASLAADGTVYVAAARWFVPLADEPMPKKKRNLVEVYGGYWSRTKGGRPSNSPALAWMPIPRPPRLADSKLPYEGRTPMTDATPFDDCSAAIERAAFDRDKTVSSENFESIERQGIIKGFQAGLGAASRWIDDRACEAGPGDIGQALHKSSQHVRRLDLPENVR